MKAWISVLALLGAAQGANAQILISPAPSFSVRAIVEIAPEVNGVLQEIAEPAAAVLPQSVDATEQLTRRCGGFTPTIVKEDVSIETGQRIVFYTPCVLFRQTKRALSDGSTLGALAQSSGLRTLDGGKGKVTTLDGAMLAVKPGQLPKSGYVIFDRTPLWTVVVLKPDMAADRAQLVGRFAKVLKCDGQGEETMACLDRRGFSILNGANVGASRPAASEPAPAGAGAAHSGEADHFLAGDTPFGPARYYRSMADAPDPAPVGPAPVSASQWPYDPDLVAAALMEARNRGWIGENLPTTIGVADVGLADQDGLPIKQSIFSRNPGEDGTAADGTSAEPDTLDNEPNGFTDDFYGAGQIRPGDLQPNGNLALCGMRTVTLAEVESGLGPIADHGSIVASIATGVSLRSKYEWIRGLPKLVFYRLLPQACDSSADKNASEAAVAAGLDYLYGRSPIAVLSFTMIGDQSTLKNQINGLLANKDRLLILPAGNDQAGDIDANKPLPAILGNRDNAGDSWRRILVVGAAGRDLGIKDYSGWGFDTVWLYAPGEPVGALGLKGDVIGEAPDRGATSFAAPYVGLAAGMMRAQGITDVNELRQRLLLSTWPIQAGDKADGRKAGVLDLNKAAAVRLTSVELVQQNAGVAERSTIIGSFVAPLRTNMFCAYPPTLNLPGIQAIRISDPGPGERTLFVTLRKTDDSGMLARMPPRPCTPSGTVPFKDVRGQTLQVDMSQVSAILFPWRPKE